MQLLSLLVVYLPLGIGGVIVLLQLVPQLSALLDPGSLEVTTWAFYCTHWSFPWCCSSAL